MDQRRRHQPSHTEEPTEPIITVQPSERELHKGTTESDTVLEKLAAAVASHTHFVSSSLCPFSFPSCRRQAGLFVPVWALACRGVSFGVHYIAFLVGSL